MKVIEEMKKFRTMKESELISELKNKQNHLALISLKVKVGKHDNVSEINKLKKEVARVNTIITEKRYGATDGK